MGHLYEKRGAAVAEGKSEVIIDHHTDKWYYSNNNETARNYIIQGRIMQWEIHIRTVKYRTTQQS